MRVEANRVTSRLLAHVAGAVRIGFLTMAALAAGAGSAAEPALERGNWKLTVNSTVNGKPEPVQNTEECLGDELNDLGAYFAPGLEGLKAKCKRARVPSKDPRKLNYRMQCSGAGFTINTESLVTIEGPRHFTSTMRMTTKTKKESAAVVANVEGRWTGACKPAAAKPASK